MSYEIPKQYNPKETEDTWYQFWEERHYFSAQPSPDKRPFSIVIPPPNVTGILHMGHALNNTIQDILIRYHRMKQEESLWMPGTDHAGIATQNVVEKALLRENLKRQDIGREKFIERVWLWKEQYGSTIIHQLKKLGASCDWEKTRFTMDEEYSQSVAEVFVRLYEKGLIYQGNYIINWCPRCQTALSDEEAPHREIEGKLYYIKYPLKSVGQLASWPVGQFNRLTGKQANRKTVEDYIVVATTRPETMLGDTAVAVNPKDKRYKHLVGSTLILPLVNREIKIIADSMVEMKFGTGAVKVTPAHDPNDYALGKKHRLEFVKVMHSDGRMNESAGNYKGMDRFAAREAVLKDLNAQGLLEKTEPHKLSAGHCYRCHTLIEPYLSKQWFVKMKPLAKEAIGVVKKGKIKFHPQRWTKVYLNWMQNIQDWCISRQIWWGHRIPVYYCKKCKETGMLKSKGKSKKLKGASGIIVSRIKPDKCPMCGSSDIYQDADVLDTWFSSWLWPFATFGWPTNDQRPTTNDLNYFYPTSVLVTAPEIIFFWVARMIMAGLEFIGDIPFRDVYIHGTVRDIEGKKMSKSLGNIIDPLEIINEFGADALRFSLISITAQGQDVFLSRERFEQGRNFANKIWNASRFILMNLGPDQNNQDPSLPLKQEGLSLENCWILSRLNCVLKEANADLGAFKFNEAANLLYGFFWHEFCDWYLELIKPVLEKKENSRDYGNTQIVMHAVLEKSLRLLHPFMPFVTEELWQRLNQRLTTSAEGGSACGGNDKRPTTSIMVQPWPQVQEQLIDKRCEKKMAALFEVITAIRNMRSELEIPIQEEIPVTVYPGHKTIKELIASCAPLIKNLTRAKELIIQDSYIRKEGEFVTALKNMHIAMALSGIIDIAAQRKKTEEKIIAAETEIRQKKALLENKAFIGNAPPEIVEKERAKLEELNGLVKKLKAVKDALR